MIARAMDSTANLGQGSSAQLLADGEVRISKLGNGCVLRDDEVVALRRWLCQLGGVDTVWLAQRAAAAESRASRAESALRELRRAVDVLLASEGRDNLVRIMDPQQPKPSAITAIDFVIATMPSDDRGSNLRAMLIEARPKIALALGWVDGGHSDE